MNNNIFPLPFWAHLVFVILAFALFMVQYVRVRKLYQILMAAAVVVSMLIYVNTSKLWIGIVGAVEAVLLAASLVSSIIQNHQAKAAATAGKSIAETAEEDKQ